MCYNQKSIFILHPALFQTKYFFNSLILLCDQPIPQLWKINHVITHKIECSFETNFGDKYG